MNLFGNYCCGSDRSVGRNQCIKPYIIAQKCEIIRQYSFFQANCEIATSQVVYEMTVRGTD